MTATSTPSIEVPLIRPIARTVRIGFLPQGHPQRIVLNYLQIAFNARHSPNERKGSPAGALSALSSIASRSAVIGCEAKIDRCQLRSSLTIRLSFVGVHIYVFVWSSPFRPNLRAAAVA